MAEWTKHPENPVLGPGYCRQALFDCCVIPNGNGLHMWLSWRDLHSIAYSRGEDGIHWTGPRIVLEPNSTIEWERDEVNRPCVLRIGRTWHMFYTGQNLVNRKSGIGLATSRDGLRWERQGGNPVLEPTGGWEKSSIMCPHVLYEMGKCAKYISKYEVS